MLCERHVLAPNMALNSNSGLLGHDLGTIVCNIYISLGLRNAQQDFMKGTHIFLILNSRLIKVETLC